MKRQTSQTFEDLFERHKPLRGNSVTPNLLFPRVWLRDEPVTSSVEIIELNSSNEMETSPRQKKNAKHDSSNRNHAWNHIDNEETGIRFDINKKARERHRLQNSNHFTLPSAHMSEENDYCNNITNSFFPNETKNHLDDEVIFNHQMNCFTILNKHFIDSNSSAEGEYGDVEIITSNEFFDKDNWNPDNNNYNEEIISYDDDIDQNARTIWIYSYKNKHLLPNEDVDANLQNKLSGSSTTYSTDSSSEQVKEIPTPSCRMGSPIPSMVVPRLDLSLVPTLSTVSEVSERATQPTSNTSISSNNVQRKAKNNWCLSDSAKEAGVKSRYKLEKSTNVINWMALSPREKRRVIKDKLVSDTWVGSRLDLAELCKENNIVNFVEQTTVIVQNEGVNVIVDVEVHTDVNKKKEGTDEELKSAGLSKRDEITATNKIQSVDVSFDFQKDRGDHSPKQLVITAIHCSPKTPKSSNITKPIPTQDIAQVTVTKEKETNVYVDVSEQSMLDDENLDQSIDHFWMKNTIPFLKPAQWTEFIPITESTTSFNLSLGSIVEEKQKWYTRLIRFLNCCK